MKSRSLLPLMEQLIMTLVFLLAAALCVRAFVTADLISRRSAARDRALLEAQNAIETVRASGDLSSAAKTLRAAPSGDTFTLLYTTDWVPGGDRYCLQISPENSPIPGLSRARVQVLDLTAQDDPLVTVSFSWQEVKSLE